MKQYNHIYNDAKGFEEFLQASNIDKNHTSTMVQLFSSKEKDEIEKIASVVCSALPNAVVVGSSTAGEIVFGEIYEKQTVVSISVFEKTNMEAHYAVGEDSYALGQELSKKIFTRRDAKCVITFLDGLQHNGDEYLQGLESFNFKKTLVSGGMAGDLLRFKQTYTIFGKHVFSSGAVCITLWGEDLEIYEDYNLGWRAVGPSFTVTKSEGSRVYEINNRPIKEVYAEVLGELAVENMPASTIEFPLVYEDNGMLIARSMLRLNSDGSILYGGNIDEGEEVHFGLGSRTLVNKYNPKEQLKNETSLQACFIYSCVARKQFLDKELEKTFRIIEQKAPTSGFFTYGEFFYSEQKPKFLNVTTTLLFLREKGTETLAHKIDEKRKYKSVSKTDSALFHFIDYVTEELREQERKFKASKFKLDEFLKALESVVIIARINKEGMITYVNNRLEDITGYSKEELLGRRYDIMSEQETEEELLETIRRGNIWKGALSWVSKSGKTFYTNTSIIPIHDEYNNIIEYMAVSEDVTSLVESKKKAQEAEAAQAMFLANMSHEIRTPMNGILGFTELLAKTDLDETQEKYVRVIGSSTKILLEIVNDILDSSKITQKKILLEKLAINPYEEFATTFELLRSAADEKSLLYKFHIDSSVSHCILSDSVRLRQVIINLLSNAIKFTPKFGEVRFDISVKEDTPQSQKLYFSIKDSGIGIPKAKIQEIFKPFSQADASTTRKFGGTGLGLSISSDLIKAFGSELHVESQEQEGSEFYFEITFEKCPQADIVPDALDSISGCEKKQNCDKLHLKVLVAEDYDVNRMLIESIFEKYSNITLHFAVNGEDAIEKLQNAHYDLVLMDINMPIKNGIDATADIRKKLKLDLPIVALTANALEGDAQRFFECGMNDYLSKPIDINKLERILQKYSKSEGEMCQHFVEGILEKIRAKVGLGEDIAKRLLATFLESVKETLPQLQEAVALKDAKKVYETAHKLKGASGALYIESIYEIMKTIEKNAQTGIVHEYEDEFTKITKQIKMIDQGVNH